MEVGQDDAKCAYLLSKLKGTVESMLGCHQADTWDVYGSSHRLHMAVADILKHGFRFFRDNGEPDLWVFIQGLSWLQPTLAASPSFFGHPSSPIRSPVRNSDKAMTWLYSSIDSHTLSEKLSWLISDHQHLLSCYNSTAFLRQIQYSEATLICLRALEQRQLALLAKIDPALYIKRKSITTKMHRRCLSYPEPNSSNEKSWSISGRAEPIEETESKSSSSKPTDATDTPIKTTTIEKVARVSKNIVNSVFKGSADEKMVKKYIRQRLLKNAFSSSDVYLLLHKEKCSFSFIKIVTKPARRRSFSESTQSEEPSSVENTFMSDILKVRYDRPASSTKERRSSALTSHRSENTLKSSESVSSVDTIGAEEKPSYKGKRRRRSSFFKLPFRIWEDSEDERSVGSDDSRTLVQTNATLKSSDRKSFIENGGNITLPMSLGAFPKPTPGQSIMSFLTSGVFSQMNAELDRENAHFNISEAMIAALEQVKFNQRLKLADEIIEESDEEINHLKQIIRIRRQQKQKERCSNMNDSSCTENTDNTTATDRSVNSLSSSVYSTSESISTDQDDDETTEKTNLVSNAMKGLSVSKLSVFSKKITDSNDLSVSAENVAISLLRKFKENQLPAASEIEWLVSENDAPQRILPLPNTIAVDDAVEKQCDEQTLLRGTAEWAPPRPQIIFTPHPPPSRRQLMEKQMYRCAGCGIAVAQKYASKFRYCEYLGRYFCPSCHSKQTAVIPGRVLSRWDFNKYPVSNFSYRLLDQMFTDPLFNVMDLNVSLYRRARELQKVRLLRVALFYLKDFIFSCRCTDSLKEMIKEEPSHIYTDPDNYSMADFIRVKSGKFFKTLSVLVRNCENHVSQCQLCQARGFMCEICGKQEVIFPWELNTVVRCSSCGSCHHIKCYQRKLVCPKCVRISNRNDLHKIGLFSTTVS